MIFRVLLKFDNYIVIMDHMSVERLILIWMLLSVTLGSFLFCTSQTKDLFIILKFCHLQCLGFNQFCGLC